MMPWEILLRYHWNWSTPGRYMKPPQTSLPSPQVLCLDGFRTKSKKMFHLILAHQFENRKGYQKVVNEQYALEEAQTQIDVDRSLPWTVSIRRGMRIHMSIIFEEKSAFRSSCPGCLHEQDVTQGVCFQWQGFGSLSWADLMVTEPCSTNPDM